MGIRYWLDLASFVKRGHQFAKDRSPDNGATCPFGKATMHLTHAGVVKHLKDSTRETGYLRVSNELGLLQLNPEMFPETGHIFLSSPEHDRFRPWLEFLSEGSLWRWSDGDLNAEVERLLSGRDTIDIQAEAWNYTARILFRVYAGFDPSESDIQGFQHFQSVSLKVGMMPRVLLFTQRSAIQQALEWRSKILPRIVMGLSNLKDLKSSEDRQILSQAVLELLTYAGGLSVPTWLNCAAAVLWNPQHFEIEGEITADQHLSFLYEVLRLFPPVAGVPFQRGEERNICFIGSAQRDPKVWDNPDQFQLRPWEDFQQNFIGFAEPAGNAGSRSRDCVGAELATAMALAWMSEVTPLKWHFTGQLIEKTVQPYFEPIQLERR